VAGEKRGKDAKKVSGALIGASAKTERSKEFSPRSANSDLLVGRSICRMCYHLKGSWGSGSNGFLGMAGSIS